MPLRKGWHRWKTVVTEPRSGVEQTFEIEAPDFTKATLLAREKYMEGTDMSDPAAVEMLNRLVVEVFDLGPLQPLDPPVPGTIPGSIL
jgi:hypothetical protein